jgi:hypothetical protein
MARRTKNPLKYAASGATSRSHKKSRPRRTGLSPSAQLDRHHAIARKNYRAAKKGK